MQQAQKAQNSTAIGTQRALWFLLAYGILYGFLAREWLGHAYDRLPKDLISDGWLIYWILDWVGDNLLSSPSQIFSPPINWPAVNQLAGSEHFGTFQVLYLPLRNLLGSELAALNLTIFSAYVLASWITAILLGRLGCSPLVAWVGGLLYGPIDASFRVNTGSVLKVEQALPHIMQIAHLFIPWVILGLVRLRERRTLGNSVFLAIALTLAFLSSYYMAVLTVLVASLWGLLELVRRSPGRLRFVAFSLLAAGVASGILLFVSRPYFERPEATGDADLVVSRWKTDHLVEGSDNVADLNRRSALLAEPVGFTEAAFWGRALQVQAMVQARSFPTVRTLLAIFAVAALLLGMRSLPRAVGGGLFLFLVGFFLSLPEADVLGRRPFAGLVLDPPLLDFLRETPARFVRDVHRFAPMFVLGLVVLTSAGLDALRRLPSQIPFFGALLLVLIFEIDRRWDPYPVHRLLLSETHVANLQETGRWRLARFFQPTLEENSTLTTHRDAYERMAAIIEEQGGGPLLELPADADRPETLVGQRILEAPNIFFYSGYEPPHSLLIRQLTSILPEPFALQDLMMLTDVRWIVMRRDTPGGKLLAEELRRRVGVQRLVEDSWEVDDFVLIQLGDRYRNPEWVQALSHPPEPGETILGSRRTVLNSEDIDYGIAINNSSRATPEISGLGTYLVHIVNGATTLPAARPGRPSEELSVRLRIRWVPVDVPDAGIETILVPLRRDILPSSRYFQNLVLAHPRYRGTYDLIAVLEQVGNPGAFAGKGKVYRSRFELNECADFLPEGLKEGDCVPESSKKDASGEQDSAAEDAPDGEDSAAEDAPDGEDSAAEDAPDGTDELG